MLEMVFAAFREQYFCRGSHAMRCFSACPDMDAHIS
jgi:hypothetical protein